MARNFSIHRDRLKASLKQGYWRFVHRIEGYPSQSCVHFYDRYERKVALSFDDGPRPAFTSEVSKYLHAEGIRGLFFMEGWRVLAYPELVREVDAAGHLIGNHTFTHGIDYKNDPIWQSRLTAEIDLTRKAIDYVLEDRYPDGYPHRFYRPPFGYPWSRWGSIVQRKPVSRILDDLNYRLVLWQIDAEDWEIPGEPQKITDHCMRQIEERKGGGMMLFHDSHPRVLPALKALVAACKEKNIPIVDLHTLEANCKTPVGHDLPTASQQDKRELSVEPFDLGDQPEERADEWRVANERWAPYNFRHSPEFHLAHKATGFSKVKYHAFGIRENNQLRSVFNVRIDTARIAFTVAERTLFGLPVRMATIFFPHWPGVEDEADLAEVCEQLASLLPDVDALCLSEMRMDSPFARPWISQSPTVPGLFSHHARRRVQTRFLLNAPEWIGRLEMMLSSKSRSSIKRKLRKMGRERGEVHIAEFADATSIDEFIRDAGVVTAHGWKGRLLGDKLSDYDRVYFTELARHGMFFGTVLYSGKTPVAMLSGTLFQGVYSFQRMAFDPDFKKYSPGLALVYETFMRLYQEETGVQTINMGYGHGDYKQRFSTSSYPEIPAYLYRRRWKWRLALGVLSAYQTVYDALLAILVRLNLKQALKRIVRGGE